MGGTKWREPKNSPDWIDIFSLLRAVEGCHSVVVTVTLSAAVLDGPAGFTTVTAFKVQERGDASVLGVPALALAGEWPCPEHRDYASCLYSALLELDGRLSTKLWEQLNLPFTAEVTGA